MEKEDNPRPVPNTRICNYTGRPCKKSKVFGLNPLRQAAGRFMRFMEFIKTPFIALAAFYSVFFCGYAYSFDGPLQYKNQFPLFNHLNTPFIESAVPESSLSVNLSYSSIFMVRNSAAWSVGLDMESAELAFRYKKNLGDSLELGADLPFLSFNSGFMDGSIGSFHSAFGFPNYGREQRPRDKFLYTVKKDGITVINGKNGEAGVGDARLTAKKVLTSGDPAISIKADIEIPTGNSKRGYGNGSVDTALSLLVDNRVNGWLKAYGNIGYVFPGKLRAEQDLKLRDYIYIAAAFEAMATGRAGLIAQVYFEKSPFPRTAIATLDRPAVLIAFGGRYTRGADSFALFVTEDPNTSGAPDVSFHFSYKKRF